MLEWPNKTCLGGYLVSTFSKGRIPALQRGISAIEYLVLAVVVIAVIAAAATAFGVDITAAFAALGVLINPP